MGSRGRTEWAQAGRSGHRPVSGVAGLGGSVHVLVLAQAGRVHELDYLLRPLLLKDHDLGEITSLSRAGTSVLSRPPRPAPAPAPPRETPQG